MEREKSFIEKLIAAILRINTEPKQFIDEYSVDPKEFAKKRSSKS